MRKKSSSRKSESYRTMCRVKPGSPVALLRAFFNSVPKELRSYVWSLMLAMRGPDNDDYFTKHETTARVRAVVFGKRAIGLTADISGSAPSSYSDLRAQSGSHFAFHYWDAANAIIRSGLKFKTWERSEK